MLVEILCDTCTKNPHPDHLHCDGCGANYSLNVSVQMYQDGKRFEHRRLKFCPMCGLNASAPAQPHCLI